MSVNIKFPPQGFYFSVEILGTATSVQEAGFQEVSGISATMGKDTIQEGGENRFVHKVPKNIEYTDLQLKRGLIVADSQFGDWCLEHLSDGLNSKISVKDLIVHLMDTATKSPIMSWAFARAYPVKWDVSQLDARKSDIVVESLHITYAYFTVV